MHWILPPLIIIFSNFFIYLSFQMKEIESISNRDNFNFFFLHIRIVLNLKHRCTGQSTS